MQEDCAQIRSSMPLTNEQLFGETVKDTAAAMDGRCPHIKDVCMCWYRGECQADTCIYPELLMAVQGEKEN